MKRAVAATLCLLTFAACRRESPPAPAPAPAKTGTTATTSTVVDLKGKKLELPVTVAPESLFIERSALGPALGANGAVVGESKEFSRSEQISLSMWLKKAPPELQMSAIWYDKAGKKLSEQRRDMDGELVVTFTLDKKLQPGEYRVEGFWGGNRAAEYDFKVK
ncbi:MAG TPA: hypothetical protein VF698_04730 [Thermoanaerobaculia bacterium]|jgi:hypothetical protein